MDELFTETPKSRNPPEQRVKDVPAAKVLAEYSKGQTYNTSLDLYEQVKKNERFYLGDQWSGLKVKSFTPVTLNFLRRVLAYRRLPNHTRRHRAGSAGRGREATGHAVLPLG